MPALVSATYNYTQAELAAAAGKPVGFIVTRVHFANGPWIDFDFDPGPAYVFPADDPNAVDPQEYTSEVQFSADDIGEMAGISNEPTIADVGWSGGEADVVITLTT